MCALSANFLGRAEPEEDGGDAGFGEEGTAARFGIGVTVCLLLLCERIPNTVKNRIHIYNGLRKNKKWGENKIQTGQRDQPVTVCNVPRSCCLTIVFSSDCSRLT